MSHGITETSYGRDASEINGGELRVNRQNDKRKSVMDCTCIYV